jgi:hypothetical protein
MHHGGRGDGPAAAATQYTPRADTSNVWDGYTAPPGATRPTVTRRAPLGPDLGHHLDHLDRLALPGGMALVHQPRPRRCREVKDRLVLPAGGDRGRARGGNEADEERGEAGHGGPPRAVAAYAGGAAVSSATGSPVTPGFPCAG